jgi:hypothetical protein
MVTTDKLQGTCSVCLRTMQLRGDHPIRHGFSAVGVRHGQHSGWHTGPCPGVNFPHLGISSEGTSWALGQARKKLGDVQAAITELETFPDLTWYPSKGYGARSLPDLSRPIVLKHDEEDRAWASLTQVEKDQALERSRMGAPTYTSLHSNKLHALHSQETELERTIAEYERVFATWSPEKYSATGTPSKVEMRHMEKACKASFGEWTGVLCRRTRRGYASEKLPKTKEPGEVTCKRCRAALGLPPL